jgi:hypothetical protein
MVIFMIKRPFLLAFSISLLINAPSVYAMDRPQTPTPAEENSPVTVVRPSTPTNEEPVVRSMYRTVPDSEPNLKIKFVRVTLVRPDQEAFDRKITPIKDKCPGAPLKKTRRD